MTAEGRRLEPGARIAGEKLELLRRVADGGMGSVWVARNVTTEASVAIKVLRPDKELEERGHVVERFRHEARLGAMLAHRNITRVFDLIEQKDGSLVLVMELLRGKTLGEFLEERGKLSAQEAVAVIVPILAALQHAHDHNVVHRDIKPSNIFLHVDPDGHTTPKLFDFGIAKIEASNVKTRPGDALGTPSYMSPEQVRAARNLDGRSDLFAVGVVLYEAITGENPFRAPTPAASLAAVLESEVDPDPNIDPRLWLEIQRALSKQAYARHGSASELAAALCEAIGEREALLGKHLKLAPPPALTEPPPSLRGHLGSLVDASATISDRPRSKHRLGLLLAAAGFALTLGVASLLRPSTTHDSGKESKAPPSELPSSPAATAAPALTTTTTTTTTATPSDTSTPAASASTGNADEGSQDVLELPTSPAAAKTGTPRRHAPKPTPSTTPVPSASARPIAREPGF